MTPICVGVNQAAAMIGVCSKTVREWVADKQIATVAFPSTKRPGERGKRILILVDDLKAFAVKWRVAEQVR